MTTRSRQIAEATLEAIRQAIHQEAAIAVSSMDIPVLGSRKVAVAQVVVVTEASERHLIGCAYVEDEESRAVVRSVLDALNQAAPRPQDILTHAVSTPHRLSTDAARRVLIGGGNAVDGAIAAVATQGVVAPETCGIGGDLFALVHGPGWTEPRGLNASGRAGSNADPELHRGLEAIPRDHPLSVTVPGCVDGWAALSAELGRLPLKDCLSPAIEHATEGFTVSTEQAGACLEEASVYAGHPAIREFYPEGRPVARGDLVKRPALAATLESIAESGRDAFYLGQPAADIVEELGGLITGDDLARPHADWVSPISCPVGRFTAWTIPPNSQGYLGPATLAVFEMLDPPRDPADPDGGISSSRRFARWPGSGTTSWQIPITHLSPLTCCSIGIGWLAPPQAWTRQRRDAGRGRWARPRAPPFCASSTETGWPCRSSSRTITGPAPTSERRERVPPSQPRQWLQPDAGTPQRAPAWQAAAPHPLSHLVDIRYGDTLGPGEPGAPRCNHRYWVRSERGQSWPGSPWMRLRTHRDGRSRSSGPSRMPDSKWSLVSPPPHCPISEAADTASRRWPADSQVGARSRSSKSTETIGLPIPIRAVDTTSALIF